MTLLNRVNRLSNLPFSGMSVLKKWWLIISTTIFFLLIFFTWMMMQKELNAQKASQLEKTEKYTQDLITIFSNEEENLIQTQVLNRLNDTNHYELTDIELVKPTQQLDSLLPSEINIQVFNNSKQMIFQTQNWYHQQLPSTQFYSKEVTDNNRTIIQSGGPVFNKTSRMLIGYVQVTNRLQQYYTTQKMLWTYFLWLVLAGLVVSVGLGYVLAYQLSRPLKEIQKLITSITDENISSTRLEIPTNNQELKAVVDGFNELLTKISFYIEQQKHFVEDVSHELRTPVAIVEGHLKLLNRWGKNDPEILEESLASSLTELERMKVLVQEMLDLSRASQVKEQYKDAETSVFQSVKSIVDNFKILYPDYKFVFDSDLSREVVIQMFSNHFQQICIILLDNAVKYSLDRKEIIVSLSMSMNKVEIAIQDFGMGMTDEDRRKVFSRFYRVDKARSRQKGGTGLGLSIAKELVASYNGEITVTSQLNHGSIFRIKLPIIRTEGRIHPSLSDE